MDCKRVEVERILRFPEVKTLTALGRSSIFLYANEGRFPKSIRIGTRSVGWLASEIAAYNAARIRGASEDEIRALVARLEAGRKAAA
jgi:prophage regulatory protein